MDTPVWFDQAYYLQEKADTLNASGFGNVSWDSKSVLQAMESAGMTPYEHYKKYGDAEGLNPNQYFDQNYYFNLKATKLNATNTDSRTDWTPAAVHQVFENAGLTAFEHFALYGADEGLDPSASFDVDSYLQEKADVLNTAAGSTTWTMPSVLAAMESVGLDPVSHYMAFGSQEGLTVTPVPSGQFVVIYDAATHAVSFGGTATGDIDVSVDSGVATFARGGQKSTTTVDDLPQTRMTLAGGQTLAIDHTDASALAGVTLTGAGTLKATDALTVAAFSGLHFDTAWTGALNYSIEDTVGILSTATPVTLAGATHVTAQVQSSDLDLTNNTLWSSVDQIDLHGQDDVVLSAHKQATLGIIDTSDNDTGNNTGITAKVQSGHTDLTDVTLNSAIDKVDLNGQVATLSVAEAAKTVVATGGGSYTVVSGAGADAITLANAITATVKYTSTDQFGDSIVFGAGVTDKIDISALAGDGLVNSGGSMDGNTGSHMSTSTGGFVISLSEAMDDSWIGSPSHLADVAGFVHDHLGTLTSPGDDYLLVHGASSSGLYLFRDTGDGVVQSGELTLVASVNTVLTNSSSIISA